ncbi:MULTISPECIES: recombination regulator RecX [Shewanella]|uniref:Regulatory protein RecX n=1 Tax=Shewanella marisflavi TaxID=260364 RepID=A0AAC9U1A7_9GAMM|nr:MULTISPECIES: recombination regulator RecX [Shewanella]ASJ97474.1 recombination regulator RecX [Shewanella marisflavi]QDF76025.1 recombination regulator RecX [Shewanella marisflavi]
MSMSAMQVAVGLLARRDYSRYQIKSKLAQKGFIDSEIEAVLTQCESQGYLDDARFAALLLRSHIAKGHGQNKIRQSMAQKGLAKEIIQDTLNASDCDWFELAKQKAAKKYAASGPIEDQKERAKRVRYLLSQGFAFDQVAYALEVEPDL